MADPLFLSTTRYAVVTGANKGIGLQICTQLASKGVTVVLTARDEGRGLLAIQKLNQQHTSLSHLLVFHQLDVSDPSSVASLSDFVKSKFGKLDILVNNAGVLGSNGNVDALLALVDMYLGENQGNQQINYNEIMSDDYDLGVQCLQINYYGAKRLTEALLPLLLLSDSGRIVNVSSGIGRLKYMPNERVRGVLNDVENLTEEKIDEILNEFMQDLKKEELDVKGWPSFFGPYIISKVAMNAYTRIMAKKHPGVDINCVCPGYVKTDINYNTGTISVEEGAESPVKLALLPKGEASGIFFLSKDVSPF